MPSLEEQTGPDTIAGNAGAQSVANTKMGIDAQNTLANNPNQPATDSPPSSQELVDSEMEAGQGAVEEGGEQENKEANPDDLGAAAAPPTNNTQPNVYGGNFGNSVQPSYNDDNRASNQRADANRGELGQQEYNQGATHGGYGNQYRETNPAAEHPAAEATEEKYYGEGAAQPGPQHNAYRAYDGRDLVPDQQGHAVRDTPAPQTRAADQPTATPTDGRGNTQDTRNLPDKTGPDAAFQNDNGAPTVGPAYADDYGHTSGVSLPAGTSDRHLPLGPNGHGDVEDQRSSRGGYDNQGSQGGRSHEQQPGGAPAAGDGAAPAPVNSPDAPQTEGYGYGHERSEQEKAGNPDTGDSRSGFGPGGSKEGNTSQGHGSEGGSYDDENPGARGPGYDNFTQQDKAQNYGQGQREGFRPEGGDKPADADDTAPRRNAGRDEPGQ
ncbi:hypothetical protein [Hymenobacter bucti]|uniref:Uncharacterized protein n=1 Tax=Hymenobacter bucti TaxID=1844114 RepID=A0ABW4QQU6_9BACT